MPLTPFALDNAKAAEKPYKLSDGDGLHLLIKPNGSKLWRFRYRFAGVEKMLALGSYPATKLAEAREKRNDARAVIEAGNDPSVQKKLDRLAAEMAARNTFKHLAEEHVANLADNGASSTTVEKHRWLLEDVARPIAHRPIADLTAAELLDLLKRVERSGRRETAKRLRSTIGSVFRLAVVTLRAESDPTWALKGALLRPQVQHHAAITDEKEFGAFLRALEGYTGWPSLQAALKFQMLTCARPGEARLARCAEVNFEKALWRIPAERTKMRRQHDVPLSRQAIEVLKAAWPLVDSGEEYLFQSLRTSRKPLSENAINAALRRMGYTKDEATAHGFRSTASTLLNERGYNPDVIEAALGHQSANAVRRTYNRARYWPERVKLMQDWADLLDQLRQAK